MSIRDKVREAIDETFTPLVVGDADAKDEC